MVMGFNSWDEEDWIDDGTESFEKFTHRAPKKPPRLERVKKEDDKIRSARRQRERAKAQVLAESEAS